MKTAIDSNVIIGFLNQDDALNTRARRALDAAYERGGLVICGAVYGELLAGPARTEQFIDRFVEDTGIVVDWTSDEAIWRAAGSEFQKYSARTRRQRVTHPRRILTDFYIGAHAYTRGHVLLTLDNRIYRTAFPQLRIVKA